MNKNQPANPEKGASKNTHKERKPNSPNSTPQVVFAEPEIKKEKTSTKKQKPAKKSKTGLIVFLVILFVCIIGCGVFCLGHKDFVKDVWYQLVDLTIQKEDEPTKRRTRSANLEDSIFFAYREETAAVDVYSGNPEGDLAGKYIILDAGHGGTDSGCVYPFTSPDYYESDYTLEIATLLAQELSSRGAICYMLRDDDSWVSLYNRLAQVHLICMDIAEREGELPFSTSEAEQWRNELNTIREINTDTVESGGMGFMVGSGVGETLSRFMEMESDMDNVLFLSIHINSNTSDSLHGTQIYYVTDDSIIESESGLMYSDPTYSDPNFPIRDPYYGRNNEENAILASCLYEGIISEEPALQTNGFSENADNYALLREHGLTGALIEVAFLSNGDDRALLNSDDVLYSVVYGISEGVEDYWNT